MTASELALPARHGMVRREDSLALHAARNELSGLRETSEDFVVSPFVSCGRRREPSTACEIPSVSVNETRQRDTPLPELYRVFRSLFAYTLDPFAESIPRSIGFLS